MWVLRVKFYLRQNENCSPGDSISDSSEKVLQRSRVKGQCICDFGEGGIHAIEHIFFQKLSASHEKQSWPWRISYLSRYEDVDLKEKNALCESWKLSFIWGKMETAALEPAPQIALRNCSKEAGEKDSIYVIFGEGEIHAMKHFFQKASASIVKSSLVKRNSVTMKDFSGFLDMRRCKNWAHKISSWEYLTIWRPVQPLFPEHRGPHVCSPPWTFSRVLEVSSCSSMI